MPQHSIGRAMFSGFVATALMLFFGFVGSHFGFPYLDWAHTFSDMLGGKKIVGYVGYFAMGIFAALIYVQFLRDRLPGASWRRGMLFAMFLWIITGAFMAPLLHLGFFMGSIMMALGTLATYLSYGAMLGYLYDAT